MFVNHDKGGEIKSWHLSDMYLSAASSVWSPQINQNNTKTPGRCKHKSHNSTNAEEVVSNNDSLVCRRSPLTGGFSVQTFHNLVIAIKNPTCWYAN